MIRLILVPTSHIDRAWKEGAHQLAKACETSGGEITGDQLKMRLGRGERHLFRMDDEDANVGWAVIGGEQLPNMRVMWIYELWAPNSHFERFMDEVRGMATAQGCSRVRCAAKPAQARLYRMRLGFKPVYETLEVEL